MQAGRRCGAGARGRCKRGGRPGRAVLTGESRALRAAARALALALARGARRKGRAEGARAPTAQGAARGRREARVAAPQDARHALVRQKVPQRVLHKRRAVRGGG